MKVIIPMSGEGKRFKDAGYTKLKPLIFVDGKPILEHVVDLFSPDDDFLFVCSSEHLKDKTLELEKFLKNLRPHSKIIEVNSHKLGPNYAILAASELLDDDPVFVSYCDFNLKWNREDFLRCIRRTPVHSAAVCYKGFHPHLLNPNVYAGVRVDDNMFAREVKEKHSFTKNKMDTWQQSGLFYFSSGNLLREYCERAFREGWLMKGESYTSLLFDPMIGDGLVSLVYPAEHFCQWGTPEDLEEYEAWARLFAEKYGKKKGVTEIPSSREKNVYIRYAPDSDEYRKSYEYWEKYFFGE